LGEEEVESLLALHALLLVGIVLGETRRMGRDGWVTLGIVEFESVLAFALFIEEVT